MAKVLKSFATVNRRFVAGDEVVAADIDSAMSFDDLVSGEFIALDEVKSSVRPGVPIKAPTEPTPSPASAVI